MIGLFDSGVGGLSVLKELRAKVPEADVLYFGDIANAPYGPKSKEELVLLTVNAMTMLHDRGASQFVAACNSVSVSVIQPIVSMFGEAPGHIIEMVGPSARAVKKTAHEKILVIATEATVRSGLYERTFQQEGMEVSMLAVPELAFAIERGAGQDEIIKILKPAISSCSQENISTLVLGCTHFPLVKDILTSELQKGVSHPVVIVDPAHAVSEEVIQQFDLSGSGKLTFLLSKDSETFRRYANSLFGDAFVVEVLE
ncbi:glutamate racemase [Candidatus Uhrbacteria bacterium]|nr:glutamate racemase [Candidatus Uhrbacteria bacterium]